MGEREAISPAESRLLVIGAVFYCCHSKDVLTDLKLDPELWYQDDLSPSLAEILDDTQKSQLLSDRMDQMFVLAKMTPSQLHYLSLRYGITDGYPKTLTEVGNISGISREGVRNIVENAALRKLRNPKLSENILEFLYHDIQLSQDIINRLRNRTKLPWERRVSRALKAL